MKKNPGQKVHFGNTQKYLDLVNRSPETYRSIAETIPKTGKSGYQYFNSQTVKRIRQDLHVESRVGIPELVPEQNNAETLTSSSVSQVGSKRSQRNKWEAMFGDFFWQNWLPLFLVNWYLLILQKQHHLMSYFKYQGIRT